MIRTSILAVALCGLAACGGGGGSSAVAGGGGTITPPPSGPTTPTTPTGPVQSPLEIRAAALNQSQQAAFDVGVQLENSTVAYVLENEFRATGSGTYDGGFIALNEINDRETGIIGDATLTVEFGGTDIAISGGVDNLVHTDKTALVGNFYTVADDAVLTEIDGELVFSDTGVIIPTDNFTFLNFQVSGLITIPESLNDKPGSVNVGISGTASAIPIETGQAYGAFGLLALREDDQRLTGFAGQALFEKTDVQN